MAKDFDFPGSEFIKERIGDRAYTVVPLGFAEWVEDIDVVLPGIALRVDKLLRDNEVYEALELYEALDDNFFNWMKIMRQRNAEVFEVMNFFLACNELSKAIHNFRLYTAEALDPTYH